MLPNTRSHRNHDSAESELGQQRLVSRHRNRYPASCIDTGSGTGFCAEHSAIAAMVTAAEYRIAKIVAAWRDQEGRLYVLPPCGRCREFIRQIDPANIETEVILGLDNSAPLSLNQA